jgi:hypothetical protein
VVSVNASKGNGDERGVIDNMARDTKAGCEARVDVRQTSSEGVQLRESFDRIGTNWRINFVLPDPYPMRNPTF